MVVEIFLFQHVIWGLLVLDVWAFVLARIMPAVTHLLEFVHAKLVGEEPDVISHAQKVFMGEIAPKCAIVELVSKLQEIILSL